MSKGITDRALSALVQNPPSHRVELKDGTIDGLVIRAGPRGRPTWTFRFRIVGAGGITERGTRLSGAKYHRISLGVYPTLTIKAARLQAAAYLASIERGEDPIATLEDNAVRRADTVSALVDEYLDHAKESMRSWRNASWNLTAILFRHGATALLGPFQIVTP